MTDLENASLSWAQLRAPLFSLLALSLFVLAGCGGGGDSDQLSGTVKVDGSSTVFPLTEAVAEEFMKENPRARVTVGVSGTGGGFSKFVRKETDINDASRPIRPSEAQLAEKNGVEYIELPVSYDGLAVVVNPKNDWVDCLTTEELEQIWEPDSDIDNWNQVRSSFPDRSLDLYGPGTASGTYDYFTASIIGEEGASRSDFTSSEDDNVLVQGVSGDPNALGFFGLAYFEENQDKLKLLGVDNNDPSDGEGCIKPSLETVNNGTYQPLSRPEFIYVNAESASKPAVDAFVKFYLSNADTLAREVGYVPLSQDAYDLALQRFNDGVTGSLFDEEGSVVGVRIADLLRRAQGSMTDTTAAPADTTSM